jgi:hypothetical protein
MKKQYVSPQLTVHGNVAEITQVLDKSSKTDFVFQNGVVISDGDDLGSTNITLP